MDTSVWIEWLIESDLSQTLTPGMPERENCIVPTIVQLELYKWLLREKGEDEADTLIAYTQKCVVVPLDAALALKAAELCRDHRLATPDAIIYATTLKMEAELLTCDAHFDHLPHVRYFTKTVG